LRLQPQYQFGLELKGGRSGWPRAVINQPEGFVTPAKTSRNFGNVSFL